MPEYIVIGMVCLLYTSPSCWAGQIALFDALGKGVYGWREAGKLAAYAFCWEDTAQEAFGMTPEREQGLLEVLRKDAFPDRMPYR